MYILIKQFMVQSNLVSTSQHGCIGVGCHQTIGTSGTVGHVISTHQSGSQAVPMKTPHRPVSLVQITHVSGSHGTISWWRSIIRHWFTCNLHKIPSSYTVCLTGEVGSYNTISMLMKYCTNVAHCVNSCHGGFSLTGSEAGRCPACTCTSVLRVFLISHCVFPHVPCTILITRGDWYPPLLIKYLLICTMKL